MYTLQLRQAVQRRTKDWSRHDVKMVILVKVAEDPACQSPTRMMEDEQIVALNLPHFLNLTGEMMSLKGQVQIFDLLLFSKITCVGRME